MKTLYVKLNVRFSIAMNYTISTKLIYFGNLFVEEETWKSYLMEYDNVLPKGYDVLYVHSSPIIGPSNNEGSLYPPYVRCKHVDLLVIDNVGRDDSSKRSAELLEALLHSRIENKLPTIITMAQEMNSTIDMIQSESESSASNTSFPLIDCFLKFMSKAYRIQMIPTNHYRDQALARAKEVKD